MSNFTSVIGHMLATDHVDEYEAECHQKAEKPAHRGGPAHVFLGMAEEDSPPMCDESSDRYCCGHLRPTATAERSNTAARATDVVAETVIAHRSPEASEPSCKPWRIRQTSA